MPTAHGLALLGNSNGVTRQANGNLAATSIWFRLELQVQYGGSFTA